MCLSSGDHWPSMWTPWQAAPQPSRDTSDSKEKSGFLNTRFFSFHLVSCSIHQVSSSLASIADKGQGVSYDWFPLSRAFVKPLHIILQIKCLVKVPGRLNLVSLKVWHFPHSRRSLWTQKLCHFCAKFLRFLTWEPELCCPWVYLHSQCDGHNGHVLYMPPGLVNYLLQVTRSKKVSLKIKCK